LRAEGKPLKRLGFFPRPSTRLKLGVNKKPASSSQAWSLCGFWLIPDKNSSRFQFQLLTGLNVHDNLFFFVINMVKDELNQNLSLVLV